MVASRFLAVLRSGSRRRCRAIVNLIGCLTVPVLGSGCTGPGVGMAPVAGNPMPAALGRPTPRGEPTSLSLAGIEAPVMAQLAPPATGPVRSSGLRSLAAFTGSVPPPVPVDARQFEPAGSALSPSPQDVIEIKRDITGIFAERGLPPELAVAMAEAESNFRGGLVPQNDDTFGIFQNHTFDVRNLGQVGLVQGLENMGDEELRQRLMNHRFSAQVAALMIQSRMAGILMASGRRVDLEGAVKEHAGLGEEWRTPYAAKINGNLQYIDANPATLLDGKGGPDDPIPDVPGTGGLDVGLFKS